MLAVVRIASEALESWCQGRTASTPPLIVSVDEPLPAIRRRLHALGQPAFIVDVSGSPCALLVGDDGALLQGPEDLQAIRPFLRKAQESQTLLEVVVLDRNGVVDTRLLQPGRPCRRPVHAA